MGRQARVDHIPTVLESQKFELVAVCDVNLTAVKEVSEKLNVKGFTSLSDLIRTTKCDAAIVAVPHNQYLPILKELADADISILKEKPFATTIEEACQIHRAVNKKVFLGVTRQRRFKQIYQAFLKMLPDIGKTYSIEGRYTFNVTDLSEGWRASKEQAGGGALVDMGYHLIDLLVWYFGTPQTVTARITRGNREGQPYDVEDTVNMLFDFHLPQSYDEKAIGNFLISRVYPKKEELLIAYGTKGILELKNGQICRYGTHGEEIEKPLSQVAWPFALIEQLNHFGEAVSAGTCWDLDIFKQHLSQVAIIESSYQSDRQSTSCRPDVYVQKALEVCSK